MSVPAATLDARAHANRAAVNRLRWPAAASWAVPAGLVAGLAAGVLLHWALGIVVALAVGAAVLVLRARTVVADALATVLEVMGARPAGDGDHPRYANLVEGLTITTGIDAPTLWVVDDPAANAAAMGSATEGAIVVTSGLLETLGRVELEGVLAECLYRVRVHEAELATSAAVLRCRPILRTGPADQPVPPDTLAGRVARLGELLGAQRHLQADISASALTRYPPGLRAAFVAMAARGTAVGNVTWGTAHLWMCDPLPTAATASDHPPLQHRIDLLAEL